MWTWLPRPLRCLPGKRAVMTVHEDVNGWALLCPGALL